MDTRLNSSHSVWRSLFAIASAMACLACVHTTAQAAQLNSLSSYCGGVSAVLDPAGPRLTGIVEQSSQEIHQVDPAAFEPEEHSTLVMTSVSRTLNVREEPTTDSPIVGKLYKDCGGEILDRQGGWTRLQSGNLIGWASDEYLLFDDEAEALALSVGITMAHVEEGLNVRTLPSKEGKVLAVLPAGDDVEVIDTTEDGWAHIDYEGDDGYVSMDYVTVDFHIDHGETLEEVKERERAEYAAKLEAERHKLFDSVTTDADSAYLLAALIQCEAGNQPYEGQLAVGAVVMNRVRNSAYPSTIHGVIYASGQFTPASSGRLDRLYSSGEVKSSCIQAAKEALSGVSNVSDFTHFRRDDGRKGIVIGNHVFY